MDHDTSRFRIRPAAVASRLSWGTIARSAIYHAKTAVLVFLVVLALGIALALLMPSKYRSEARLLTLPSDYYALQGPNKEANDSAEAFKPEQLTNVEMQLLSSQDLQREALIRSGVPSNDPVALESARKAFAKNLSIERVEGANVIELGYMAKSPRDAAARLQNLLSAYFSNRARILTSGRSGLIAQQRDAAQKELNAADVALRSFQERNGIVDIDGQVSGAIAVDTALRQDLAATRASLSQTRGSAGQMRSASSRVPREVELYRDDTEATKAIADMQSQILALEAKRADLQGRYMQGSPLIVQTDKQIDGLKSAIAKQSGQLKEARRVGRNTVYDSASDRILQTDAAASGDAAKLGRLDRELADSSLRLRNLNEVAAVITRLRTQREVADQRFRALTTQLEDARAREIEANTGGTNVKVIQQPSIPDSRSNSPVMLIAGSIIAGLVLAAATLFALIARRTTILDPHEVVESLHLPVALDLRTPLVAARRSAERLPTLLGRSDQSRSRGRIIALVAAEPAAYGEELAGLVRMLASQGGGSVATVTFEEPAYRLEHARLSRLMPQQPGRGSVKVGSVAWTIEDTGARLLASLRDEFRYTVLLVPPVVAATQEEAREAAETAIAALADDVLLVVRTEATERPAAENLIEALRELNVAVRGVVLTGRRIVFPKAIRSLR